MGEQQAGSGQAEMKTYRATSGPLPERVYYPDADIENICSEELQKVGLLPTRPEPVRIERFIEKRFNIVPSYDDLPDGVLGLSKFGARGAEEVIIARWLDDDTSVSAERRIRSTLAHEAGHCLLHGHLFALSSERQLFGDYSEPKRPKILCREGSDGSMTAYDGKWWEYHANRTIGGLLLPKHLVQTALEKFLIETGSLGLKTFDFSRREEAAREMATVFDVNPAVARIRIDQLYKGGATDKQLSL
jgi:hypothetical protein